MTNRSSADKKPRTNPSTIRHATPSAFLLRSFRELKTMLSKRRIAIASLCAALSTTALAAENGQIIDRRTYTFPSYEEAVAKTDVELYADKTEYDKAVADRHFEMEKLTYTSDGLKVLAYFYHPEALGHRQLPAIVFNRGSAVRGDIAPELVTLFHRLAARGFIVIAPLLRQSDTGEGRDELGGADVNDVMNLVPLAKSLGVVDMKNLFMYGESRGGMMTYQAIKRNFPLNAAAVFGAFTDLRQMIESHPKQYPPAALRQLFPQFDEQQDQIFKSRSAINWAELLTTPLLIMHGGADKSVDPAQSLKLAEELQRLGRTYQLIVYAEDNHILAKNREDRDRQAIAWFKTHLKK